MSPREWSRLPGETDANYAAFQEWLHSADVVGRKDVYEWARARARDDDAAFSDLLRAAASDFWVIRAQAYDDWVGKRAVVRTFPVYSPVALLMRKIIKTELEKISAMQDKAGDMPGSIDARMIRGWAMEVRKTEEYAVKAEAALAAAQVSGKDMYDFTKLEIEELRVLERLHEKAKVGE